MPERNRKSIRLKTYDYSRAGAYFITICAKNRGCLFGEIIEEKMVLNNAGQMVESVLAELSVRFPKIELDESIIMPNHFHGIILFSRHYREESCIGHSALDNHRGQGDYKNRPYGTPPDTLGRIVQAFKSITTLKYINGVKHYHWPSFSEKLWQRNYYEHIIRDENDLEQIRGYIINNPMQWESDKENPFAKSNHS